MKTQVLRTRGLVPVMVGAWMALFGLTSSPTATAASEIRLENIARSEFARPRTISGLGLVTGLDGTGDTGGLAAARMYIQRLKQFEVVKEEDLPESILKEGGVALVMVEATVQVVRQGGRFVPCSVTVGAGGATSLEGGRLWLTPLKASEAPLVDDPSLDFPVAFAQGRLTVVGEDLTNARIEVEGGSQGAFVVPTSGGENGVFDDFYDSPDWRGRKEVMFDITNPAHRTMTNAARLADAINEELMEDGFVDLARILSGGGVVVRLPEQETDAFRFAARIEQMMIDFRIIEVPAVIRWDEISGVLAITGNTRLLDASVAVEGFQIQRLEPKRPATLENPDVMVESNVLLTGRETPSLSLMGLKAQLEKLRVPASKQAEVLRLLAKNGSLNARFVDENAS